MRNALLVVTSGLVLLAAGACRRQPEPVDARGALPQVGPGELRSPEAFGVIADRADRSRALFLEASRVLLHPRCANCHPDGDTPYHGTDWQPHNPPVVRGPEDRGVVGMECTSCHQDRNLELARVPGAPNWHLAPRSMAWVGKSPRAICEQLKDPKRNGGKTLAQIVEHNAHDELVGWGWTPGADRQPAPGNQKLFGAIVAAWADTGAECPSEEARP
ncbi:Isoquinoline 1-oxidoreductase subunit [Archangium violaceum]|uniref:Isoquinoline 1-oxidoreductase subunit n=1 Tax=Archangium violaceum TaxID=83451 RepID=UPI00194F4EDF|nr:Isoquinoline 1-oxidoreductase subunit [Archangium violaceum]QRO01598.1 Isoquinoline 1-oxidoreductase subunit [Archangium violaceum]